jgi:hypothetical protein
MTTPREISREAVLDAMRDRVGVESGATVADLVCSITGRVDPAEQRRFRQVVEQLRREGLPICSTTSDGYWWAANAEELDAACRFLVARSMTSLEQVAAMKHVALPDLYGQLGPDFEGDTR